VSVEEARRRIAGLNWWHTIEVAPGVVTPGSWDLRPTAARMPWPSSIAGLRCLDVGTMDGFWAFELERRGAGEVLAIDPSAVAGPGPRERFRVAAELLGSRAEYRDLDVYDLDPAAVGEFDLVVMGYVLQMLRDPLRGLEAVRSVCRGHLILLETVSIPLSLLPSPLARLDARRDGTEWFVFNRRGLEKACRLAGFEVEAVSSRIRDRGGPAVGSHGLELRGRAMYVFGIRGRSAAIRARPATRGA
jgi:tRNA (mo5U34)-methyltransferase